MTARDHAVVEQLPYQLVEMAEHKAVVVAHVRKSKHEKIMKDPAQKRVVPKPVNGPFLAVCDLRTFAQVGILIFKKFMKYLLQLAQRNDILDVQPV